MLCGWLGNNILRTYNINIGRQTFFDRTAYIFDFNFFQESDMGSIQLLKVKVEVFNTTFCNSDESYDGIITPNMFCAGDTRGEHDACQVIEKSCNE